MTIVRQGRKLLTPIPMPTGGRIVWLAERLNQAQFSAKARREPAMRPEREESDGERQALPFERVVSGRLGP